MQSIPYEFTDKSISPWGGLRLIEEYFKVSGFRSHLRSLPLHIPGSGAGYMHAEIIESFIISVILGARRCSESAILRVDEVVKEIFGWDRGMPDQSTLSRFFRKYSREKSSQLFIGLLNWWFKKFKDKKLTIDIDSTVIDRYGKQ